MSGDDRGLEVLDTNQLTYRGTVKCRTDGLGREGSVLTILGLDLSMDVSIGVSVGIGIGIGIPHVSQSVSRSV